MDIQNQLNKISAEAVREIVRGGKWTPSQETREAEYQALIISKKIMQGRGQVIEFRQAIEVWKQAGTR